MAGSSSTPPSPAPGTRPLPPLTRRTGLIIGVSALAVGAGLALGSGDSRGRTAMPAASPDPVGLELSPVSEARCDAASTTSPNTAAEGNPRARAAAQRGLDFLAAATSEWQSQHQCYGCHVQAVTLEAMAVGKSHQYDFDSEAMDRVLEGMTSLPGGSRSAGGLQYRGGSLLNPSKAFGGAAFARYDALVGSELGDDLVSVATELLERQRADGGYDMQYDNQPVSTGDIHGTYLAIRTWKQAFETTADPKWLTAVQRAEDYLRRQTGGLLGQSQPSMQHLSYALMGLMEAGVGAGETLPSALVEKLIAGQQDDGSWLEPQGKAPALATGLAVHALRAAGMTENDRAVARGMAYLIDHQKPDGSWSTLGSQKAEAMWAVLGLVTMDVLSIDVSGVVSGGHLPGPTVLRASARDNSQGGGGVIRRMEIFIDDIRVASACSDGIELPLDGSRLSDGKHVVLITAENGAGKKSSRRLEIYTGDTFITQLGTRYQDGNTVITGRNLSSSKGTVAVAIEDDDGEVVARFEVPSAQGALDLAWDGRRADGEQAAGGKYRARIELTRDGETTPLQSESVSFVHSDEKTARARYGGIAGTLQGGGGANAELELVDDDGRVVERTRSTRKGRYNFKNVASGKYRVRMKKAGFAAPRIEVEAKAGEAAQADLPVQKKSLK